MGELSKLLVRHRGSRKLRELASVSNLSAGFLSDVLSAKKLPGADSVAAIAGAFGLTPMAAWEAWSTDRADRAGIAVLDAPPPQKTFRTTWRTPNIESFTAAREHVRQTANHEIASLRFHLSADRHGNARTVRNFEGVRPLEGRTVREFAYQDIAKAATNAAASGIAITDAPKSLRVQSEASVEGTTRTSRLLFPEGFRHEHGPLSYSVHSHFNQGLSSRSAGPEGLVGVFVSALVTELTIVIDFPHIETPQSWRVAAWYGQHGQKSDNFDILERGACADYSFLAKGEHAEFAIGKPLAGINFSVIWTEAEDRHSKRKESVADA